MVSLNHDLQFYGRAFMKIESHDVTLEKLLQGNYFVIPKFQRPYSWEADQINDFWIDINASSGESYFIGSMVVYKTKDNRLAVVDGQQRLTTISIFLSAIRDMFLELGSKNSAEGLQQFIERKDVDNKNIFVLETESSFPYLQEVVFKIGEPDAPYDVGREEKAIAEAYNLFSQSIAQKVSSYIDDPTIVDKEIKLEKALSWLKHLRTSLLNLSIILVTLDNEDDAYMIFETLNTRGKDLALSDLLKNHFVRNLKPKGSVDSAKLKWEKILEIIHGSEVDLDPDNFIVHSWQSRYDVVTKGKAFKKIRGAITKSKASEHLDMFLQDASLWRAIFEPEYKFGKVEREVSRSLSVLREFRVIQPVPGILSLLRAYDQKIIKLKKLVKALRAIENFHYAFTAVTSSRSSGGISGMYSSFGRKLFEAEDSNQAGGEIQELIGKLRDRFPSPTEFDASFEQIYYTKNHTTQKFVVRYTLERVSEFEEQPALGSLEYRTIEHLLPQSSIDEGVSAEVVGQIGNLILVDAKTNGELSNKSFFEKKEILEAKGYRLPTILRDAEELSPEIIVQNTRRISELARSDIWKI